MSLELVFQTEEDDERLLGVARPGGEMSVIDYAAVDIGRLIMATCDKAGVNGRLLFFRPKITGITGPELLSPFELALLEDELRLGLGQIHQQPFMTEEHESGVLIVRHDLALN